MFVHVDPAAEETINIVQGGAEDGEDEEGDSKEDKRETVADGVESCHVLRELVPGDAGDVVGVGHVGAGVQPPCSVSVTDLLCTLVDGVERVMFATVGKI